MDMYFLGVQVDPQSFSDREETELSFNCANVGYAKTPKDVITLVDRCLQSRDTYVGQ